MARAALSGTEAVSASLDMFLLNSKVSRFGERHKGSWAQLC